MLSIARNPKLESRGIEILDDVDRFIEVLSYGCSTPLLALNRLEVHLLRMEQSTRQEDVHILRSNSYSLPL